MDGRSLRPLLTGRSPRTWREYVVSEYDYAIHPGQSRSESPPRDARLRMIADGRWKYMHAVGFRPMLFDLANRPERVHDLGADQAYADVRQRFNRALRDWALRSSQRITRSTSSRWSTMRGRAERRGVLIGVWDKNDVPDEMWKGYLGER